METRIHVVVIAALDDCSVLKLEISGAAGEESETAATSMHVFI